MGGPEIVSLLVRRGEKNVPLLAFLATQLRLSKKKAKTLLDRRHVFVNKQRIWIAHHPVREGDLVEILRPSDRPVTTGQPQILFEDRLLVVVDKPPDITTTGPGSFEARLCRVLNLPALRAVHRLDRNTSGCLLFAKSAEILEYFKREFQEHRVRKVYHTIVAGCVARESFTIRRPIEGQPAITHVRTLDRCPEASHLLMVIETGRTHQIRRHLAAYRHPVLGDRHYATSVPATERTIRIPRQMLHCHRLTFSHPATGERVSVQAPLPPDFRACLKLFRLT
ncbi:MAG: RluA family pseudouridine synthase [Kiritimatiellia bacterium]